MADVYTARKSDVNPNAFPGRIYEDFYVGRWNRETGNSQGYTVRFFEDGKLWIRNQISKQVIDNDGRIGKKILQAVEELKERQTE